MAASRFLAIALTALLSAAAVAQEAPAAATPDAAAASMSAPCATQVARHDHGAEKGAPAPKMSGCSMAAPTASAVTTKPKAKLGHDHVKFHKLM